MTKKYILKIKKSGIDNYNRESVEMMVKRKFNGKICETEDEIYFKFGDMSINWDFRGLPRTWLTEIKGNSEQTKQLTEIKEPLTFDQRSMEEEAIVSGRDVEICKISWDAAIINYKLYKGLKDKD